MVWLYSIQRAVFKIFISVFLSREFKHDEANRAWWTGVSVNAVFQCSTVPTSYSPPQRWWNRGMGGHAWSQPAREFIVKLVEMSLFAADFLAGHLLLFLLTIPCLIPGFDTVHSTLLCESWGPQRSAQERCLILKILRSLAASVQADQESNLQLQATRVATQDHLQVRHLVRARVCVLCRFDRFAGESGIQGNGL